MTVIDVTVPSIHQATWTQRTAIRFGSALTEWGVRRATLRTAPTFADQLAAVERTRDKAARQLPQLPR
ncbi:hypothetical protein [Leifsonia sp. NCR5]|uniref:hypothetical protein n=1 Tax=Leifsonia sp. NCR5 TaxID=1978342 RepID=UPI000A192ACD|nr:hypothetical protein [Leifsonia sp. NCR5]